MARLTEHWADLALIEATRWKAVATQLNQSGAQTGIAAQKLGEFDLATAKALATAAETKALMVGVPIVFAAVDAAGNLMLVHRMADSLLASIDIAINKAWSSAAFKQTTATWEPRPRHPVPLCPGWRTATKAAWLAAASLHSIRGRSPGGWECRAAPSKKTRRLPPGP